MTRLPILLAALLWLSPLTAHALEPFLAHYEVYRGDRRMGEATLQLLQTGPNRWRVDLSVSGSGVAALTGIHAEQSTVFDVVGAQYRPVSQSTVRKLLFSRRQTVGVYDWKRRVARWTGDVKDTRRGPIALQDGDMSGLLINLAVIRDAQPGATLHYRFVDDGRARDHQYVVATEPESMTAGDLGFSALRVSRVRGGNEDMAIWVAQGVPTPIRILQRENGEDSYDLRLIEYKGAP
ncbi:MAG TPA: DUF3108 domain-containing protein [Lysobacter sp.]|nr:DUF3108 domain-containing protein [Lysobacter sp.]